MTVVLEGAGEWFGDQVTLEVGRWDGSGNTGGGCEHVDEFEDEEARECAAEVGNAGRAVSVGCMKRRNENLRGEEGHVGAADVRIGNLCVESAYGDEHDGAHESTEDVLNDNDAEIGQVGATAGEDHDGELGEGCSDQSTNKRPTPESHWGILFTPLSSIVT